MLITQLRISPLLKIFFIISWRPFTRKGLWFESPYLRLSAPSLVVSLLIFFLFVKIWHDFLSVHYFFHYIASCLADFCLFLSGSGRIVQCVNSDFFVLFFMHTYTSIDQFHTQSNYIWHSFLAAKKKTPSVQTAVDATAA